MITHTNLILFILFTVSAALLCAADASSATQPLNSTRDAVGESLQGAMIWTPAGVKLSSDFIGFRKTFTISGLAKSATLHLFADVRYLLWVNGKPACRGPARFDPKGPEYDSIDIASFLTPGENTLALVVMCNGSSAQMMRHSGGLTAGLDIDAQTVLKTDSTWKWSDRTRYRTAAIGWANCDDRIDARVEDGDWTQPRYDDDKWQNAVQINGDLWGPLSARRIPLLRDTPQAIRFADNVKLPVTLAAGQKLTFKLDRMVQAYTVLELDADDGAQIALDYADIAYVARAGVQTYISSGTHSVYDGVVSVKSGRVTIRSLQLIEHIYPFDIAGSFKCSDETLTRLWATCARTLQLISEDAYVDCADRERAEWMDCDPPAFDITRTAMSAPGLDGKPIYADARLLGEMLRRTALSLQPEGWVKAHTCSDRFDIHAKMEDRACDWVQGARRYYDNNGDKTLVKEIWPAVVRQMDWFLTQRTSRGLVRAREWIIWGNPVGYQTLEGTGLNAFVYKALVDAAYLARAIDDQATAAKYAAAATALAGAVNRELWDDASGTYFSGYFQPGTVPQTSMFVDKFTLNVTDGKVQPCMQAALWALDQGIVPSDRRASVTKFLLVNRGESMRIMGYYYLFLQLYAQHTPELDAEVLETLRTKWKPMANWKWQSTWEEFEGGSQAHCYGMFPGYFLTAYVLGVRVDDPASNKRMTIEPHPGGLTFAEGVAVTEFGPVPVSWKQDDAGLRMRFTVPAGITAILKLPAGDGKGRLMLNDEPVDAKADGRYLVTVVGPGDYSAGVRTGN